MKTYRELLTELLLLSDAQLDCNITLFKRKSEEYYPIEILLHEEEETDVLDKGHPFFQVSYL